MELVKPAIGLIFWMVLSFGVLVFILKKFAWAPILKALSERENSIQDALEAAKKAKEEMAQLKATNEKIMQDARNERDQLLKEAREAKDAIVSEAKLKAQQEGDRLITIARETIQNEKMAAITELKNQVATLSIDIAEKILKEELSSQEKQNALIKALLDDVRMN